MRGTIFYTIGIAFTSGIFTRSFFDIGWAGIWLVCVIGVAFLSVWRISEQRARPLLIGLACIACAVGMFRMDIAESKVPPLAEYEGEKVTLVGKIVREPEVRETNVHLYVQVYPTRDSEEIVFITTDKFQSLSSNISYGDTVEVEGVLAQPEAFETDGGRTFDYAGYLKARGVAYTMSFAHMQVTGEESGTFLGALFRGKEKFLSVLEEAIPEPQAGLGEGLLLGVKRALGENLENIFRETGIIHIVVLSGYNIMIVVECVMFVLSYMFLPRTRMVIGVVAIVLFAILVGLSATVIRASVMATLLIVARTTGRTYVILRALMLAGIGMLMMNPYLLVHDPGFQLSFLATLGLILISPLFESKLMLVPTFAGMRTFLSATIATQIMVLPLLLYHMGLFSVVAVLVNVLVLPMVPVAMFLTFLTGVIGMVSSIGALLVGYLAYLSLGYIILVAELFSKLPFASFQVPAFPFWIGVSAYGVLTVALFHLTKKETKQEITNDYEGWVIEEEKEIEESPETLRVSGDSREVLPFR